MASRCHNGQQLLSPLPNRASSLYSTNEGRKSSATKKKLIRDRGLIKNYQDGSENCPQLTLIQNDRQSLPPIIKSRQGSYLCLNFSSTQNQGFTHRPSASERVTAGVDENIVGLRLNYLALLKDLANAISSSKSLVSDLENVREEQCNVDHSSVSELINYTELPKIDHLLEKCRMETDNLRTVDRRLNCFFKLPPSLQLNFTWTVQALHKVLQDLISSMFYLIEQIVSSEIDNALNSNMNDTESNRTQLNKFRNVCYHIENVYNFNQIVKANGWKQHSEKKGICWKFKRGIKARTPFMYFKESPPNCNMHGVLTHSIISFSSFVKKLTSQRAEVSAMFITKFLCNLLFKEKTISDFDKQTTSLPNGFSSPRYNNSSYTNLADENGNSSTTGHQKKLLNFLRRNQRKLFQLITQIINNETVVFSQIVVDIIQLESSMMSKVSSTRAFFQVKQYLSTHLSTTKDNVHVQPDAPASKSTKRVHFGDAIEPKVYEELQQKYLNMLLMSLNKLVCRTLISECTEKSSLHHFCWIPISCADLDVATHLVHCFLLKKPKSGEVHPSLADCFQEIVRNCTSVLSVQQWDSALSLTLASSVKDKCRSTSSSSGGSKTTQTMSLCLSALEPVDNVFHHSSGALDMVDRQAISLGPKFSTELTALTALLTLEMTLRTSLIWLQTKSQQFASSASWELFHNVTRNDLTALEERLQQIVPGLKKFSMKIHGSDLSESFAMQEIEEIRHLLEGIKSFESKRHRLLVDAVKMRAVMAWRQNMPIAKEWRKRGSTALPYQSGAYVQVTAAQVLAPVIESLRLVPERDVEKLVCGCTRVVVSSWMDYILQEEIRFSHYGAHQLKLDLHNLKEWIIQDKFQFSSEIISSVLSLDVFNVMDNAVGLLCCQPQRRRGREISEPGESGLSATSTSSAGSSGNFDDYISEIDIPYKEKWLSLRVKGGQKSKLLCA